MFASRSTEFVARCGQRRPARCRAQVEVLDARRLMAAGITGTPLALTGSAGSPLPVTVRGPFVGLGGDQTSLAPVGTPAPLVLLMSSSTDPLTATGFSGTVDWGDGTAVDAAQFGTFALYDGGFQPSNSLYVDGPDHTYQAAGTYNVTIAVTEPGAATPTVFTTKATIGPPAITITGHLDSDSDTGGIVGDSITADNTPTFAGTTDPGATVVLTAFSYSTAQSLVVGTGVANAYGVWQITTVPFVDGSYAITAAATATTGSTASISLTGPLTYGSFPLVIDTHGPQITSFQVTNPRTGTFEFGIADAHGLNLPSVVAPANFMVNRPSPTPRRGQTFPITFSNATNVSSGAATITETLGTKGKPSMTRNGTYTFLIRSAGIRSLSGVSLDGEYTGSFPTGNGQPGGDFAVKVNIRNGQASGPIAITPVRVTTHATKAKAGAAKHHA